MNPCAVKGTQLDLSKLQLSVGIFFFFFRFENKKYLTNQALIVQTSEPKYLGLLKKNAVLAYENAGASGISAHTSSFCFLFLRG